MSFIDGLIAAKSSAARDFLSGNQLTAAQLFHALVYPELPRKRIDEDGIDGLIGAIRGEPVRSHLRELTRRREQLSRRTCEGVARALLKRECSAADLAAELMREQSITDAQSQRASRRVEKTRRDCGRLRKAIREGRGGLALIGDVGHAVIVANQLEDDYRTLDAHTAARQILDELRSTVEQWADALTAVQRLKSLRTAVRQDASTARGRLPRVGPQPYGEIIAAEVVAKSLSVDFRQLITGNADPQALLDAIIRSLQADAAQRIRSMNALDIAAMPVLHNLHPDEASPDPNLLLGHIVDELADRPSRPTQHGVGAQQVILIEISPKNQHRLATAEPLDAPSADFAAVIQVEDAFSVKSIALADQGWLDDRLPEMANAVRHDQAVPSTHDNNANGSARRASPALGPQG